MTQPSDMTSSSSTGTSALGQTPSVPVIPASTPRPAGPLITVIEPDAVAPLDRLGEWLFASGARLRTIRVWKGEALPATDDLGDGLVVLGGQMSAHDDAAHPWLEGLREIIRHAVADGLPTLTICLGAQVAAEALGAVTAVPSPDGGEHGVAELELTEAALVDRVLGPVIDEAVRAAVRAGISTQDGTRLPAVVSHDDAVVSLPEGATLLASSQRCPIHTWRVGGCSPSSTTPRPALPVWVRGLSVRWRRRWALSRPPSRTPPCPPAVSFLLRRWLRASRRVPLLRRRTRWRRPTGVVWRASSCATPAPTPRSATPGTDLPRSGRATKRDR